MGYRGKIIEQQRARQLRAGSWTLADIASELGVAKSSVSLWVRDVEFVPSPRRTGARRRPNVLQRRKAAEIEEMNLEGFARLGRLNEQAYLAAGAALYAGEGSKADGCVNFANSDPKMISFFCGWLRHFFGVDESRLRMRVYLHDGLDLDAAEAFWSQVADVPRERFRKGYRAEPDPSIRTAKHEHGCAYIRYSCSRTHRAVMGLVAALLISNGPSGVAQSAAQLTVNETAEGSSPSPGAPQA